VLLSAVLLIGLASSGRAQTPSADVESSAIAGNPGAVNIVAGTGALGVLFGLDRESGLRLGGVLVSNGNYLISGGSSPDTTSFNNLLLADVGTQQTIDPVDRPSGCGILPDINDDPCRNRKFASGILRRQVTQARSSRPGIAAKATGQGTPVTLATSAPTQTPRHASLRKAPNFRQLSR
jgi:hypothetical protein